MSPTTKMDSNESMDSNKYVTKASMKGARQDDPNSTYHVAYYIMDLIWNIVPHYE